MRVGSLFWPDFQKKCINSIYCLVQFHIIYEKAKNPWAHNSPKIDSFDHHSQLFDGEKMDRIVAQATKRWKSKKASILKIKQSKLHFLFLFYLHSLSVQLIAHRRPFFLAMTDFDFFFSLSRRTYNTALTLFHLTNKSPLLMGNLRAMSNLFDYTIPFIHCKRSGPTVYVRRESHFSKCHTSLLLV